LLLEKEKKKIHFGLQLFGWLLFEWYGRNTMQEFFIIQSFRWTSYLSVLNFIHGGGD